MIQMISHGIVSAALFLCVGVIYDRMHTREIAFYGGLVNKMPQYSVAFMIFMLSICRPAWNKWFYRGVSYYSRCI